MMRKSIIASGVALLLALTLSGCGDDTPDKGIGNPEPAASTPSSNNDLQLGSKHFNNIESALTGWLTFANDKSKEACNYFSTTAFTNEDNCQTELVAFYGGNYWNNMDLSNPTIDPANSNLPKETVSVGTSVKIFTDKTGAEQADSDDNYYATVSPKWTHGFGVEFVKVKDGWQIAKIS